MAEDKKNFKINHTYALDLAEEIKKKQGRAYKVVLEEEGKREEGIRASSARSTKNIILIILGIILIILGIILIYWSAKEKKESLPISPSTPSLPSVFLSQEQNKIDITGLSPNKILEKIQGAINQNLNSGAIRNISFIEQKETINSETRELEKEIAPVSARDLFFFLNIKTPELFIKSINSNFIFGSYGCGLKSLCEKPEKNKAFLILNILYPSNAYRGARDWEAKMLFYLSDFMNTELSLDDLKTLEGQFSTKNGLGGSWQNVNLKNLEARILQNKEGETLLVYGFWNDQKMIITTDKNIFVEVVRKLQ